MDAFLIVLRLSLAIIFAAAALAKLAKRTESIGTLEEFGVPARHAGWLAQGLPPIELGVASLLIPLTTARAGAFMALSLLAAFSAAIAVNLLRGRRPKCNCFGDIDAKPIGPGNLVRNALMACCAALVGSLGPGAALTTLTHVDMQLAANGLLLLLALGLLWMIVQLFRQQGRLLARVDVLELRLDQALGPMAMAPAPLANSGLPKGASAPDFELESLAGQRVTLSQLSSASAQLVLLFVDPGCSPCLALMPQIKAWQHQHGSSVSVIVIARGEQEENRERYGELGARNVLIQSDSEVSRRYQITATPSAVLLSSDGEILAQTAMGGVAILELLSDAAARLAASQRAVLAPLLTATSA